MEDNQPEIFYLSVSPATQEYVKRHGAQFSRENGWYVVGELPLELEEFVVRSPRERKSQVLVCCPLCGGQMELKESRTGNIFWGCMLFPRCKGTRNNDAVEWDGEAKHAAEFAKQDLVGKRKEADVEITKLMEIAIQNLGSEKSVERWFATPKVALGGKRPVDVMKSPGARNLLIEMLNKVNE